MARAGVGVGMLEIARMDKAMRRHPSFVGRVFTQGERRYCERAGRPAQRYAACLAARGAVLRALDVSLDDGVGRRDVSVARDAAGRPVARLTGKVAEVARERGVSEVALSLSLTHEVAVANAVALTDETRPAPVRTDDARSALMSSFREVRSVIDELERVEGESGGSAAREDVVAAGGDDAPARAGATKG